MKKRRLGFRDLIVQFIDVVCAVREELSKLFSGHENSPAEALLKFAQPEMPLHFIPDLVPKSIGDSLIYSPITEDGEFVVFGGEIKEHSIAFSRSVHAQMGEDLLGSFVGILSRRPFQMHPDLSRCVLLGLPNG